MDTGRSARRALSRAALLFLSGCAQPMPPPDAPTWHRDVRPLLVARCSSCHAEGGVAPLPLLDYADARPLADRIAATTAARTMPPWAPADAEGCAPDLAFVDEAQLSDDELVTLHAWAEGGAPEGDPRQAPATPPAPPEQLDRVDLRLALPAPYPVPIDATDTIRCFVLDPQLDAFGWFDGLAVVPGVLAAVHHVLVQASSPEAAEALDRRAEEGGGSSSCDGLDPAASGLSLLATWTPGSLPLQTPTGSALGIPAGARIVLQIHYHSTGEPVSDSTVLLLRRSAEPQPARARVALLGNANAAPALLPGPDDPPDGPAFLVPAGARAHVESMEFAGLGGVPLTVFAAGAHMHYAGAAMEIVLHKATGGRRCLLAIPAWDPNDQRLYRYDAEPDELPVIEVGDSLELRCTYDNSSDNLPLRDAFAAAGRPFPADLRLGSTALSEMCIATLGLVQASAP